MSKNNKITVALASAALLAGLAPMALPTAAMAQQANGITNCDAPGGRQQTGAIIGALIGGLAGSQISSNERGLGAVVGAGAGAAAGSYVGCNQQRARQASSYNSDYSYNNNNAGGDTYRATSNLRVRSGPGTNYGQVGSLSAGQTFSVVGSEGEWVQLSNGGWVSAHYVSR
ncbi:MAG: SH3 domain-containing protein [Brevundimonas sp.]|uniref:SH3 domain-containing protein n=1 Tax=Brevundimonas sp. TaxID=1871086 RepID=UPI003918BFFF